MLVPEIFKFSMCKFDDFVKRSIWSKTQKLRLLSTVQRQKAETFSAASLDQNTQLWFQKFFHSDNKQLTSELVYNCKQAALDFFPDVSGDPDEKLFWPEASGLQHIKNLGRHFFSKGNYCDFKSSYPTSHTRKMIDCWKWLSPRISKNRLLKTQKLRLLSTVQRQKAETFSAASLDQNTQLWFQKFFHSDNKQLTSELVYNCKQAALDFFPDVSGDPDEKLFWPEASGLQYIKNLGRHFFSKGSYCNFKSCYPTPQTRKTFDCWKWLSPRISKKSTMSMLGLRHFQKSIFFDSAFGNLGHFRVLFGILGHFWVL